MHLIFPIPLFETQQVMTSQMRSLAMFEAATRVKSTHLKNLVLKREKKRENREIKKSLRLSLSKRSFKHKIHSLIRRADARESADIIYRI